MALWHAMLSRVVSRAGPVRFRGPAASGDPGWVDEFIRNVRPYVFVRTVDNVLIKRPNQVARLNPTGAASGRS
jgi:hypothetical protein